MAQTTANKDYINIPKQEYNLLKEIYRTVKRQAFLMRIDEAEKNLKTEKTKVASIDDFIASVQQVPVKPTSIRYDSAFEKRWNKFVKGLTVKQKEQIRERLAIFKEDIFDKRLKTHRLKGNLKAYYAFSVSYSDRIVFKILDDNTIYFIEIGSHDICY